MKQLTNNSTGRRGTQPRSAGDAGSATRRAAPASPARGGFTLIELLVVLAIVALLVSVLLPALGKARAAARTSLCGSGLRQMAIAVTQYTHENADWLFPWREDLPGETIYWFGREALPTLPEGQRIIDRTRGRLWRYYEKTDSIEICPSFPRESPKYKPKFTTNWATYGVPRLLTEPGAVARVSRLAEPSRTAAFIDSAQLNTFQPPASPVNPMFEQWFYVSASERTVLYSHGQRAQGALFDGHVTTLLPEFGVSAVFPEAPIGFPPSTLLLQAP